MTEPQVAGQPISAFVDEILDRLLCFVEEMTAYALAAHMPAPIILREIPLAERRTDYPQRFVIALGEGGATPWQLTYHESRFEDT